MPAHYGVMIVPDAHKNALNVVLALWQVEEPSESENIGQPLNASGSSEDPVTHWVGGRLFVEAELPVIQNLAANLPSASWPVQGILGSASEQDATDAATALRLQMGTTETYTSQFAQETLAAVLDAMGLQRVTG